MARMSDRRPELPNRQIPFTDAFKKFIADGWAPYPTQLPDQLPAVGWARLRRERISDLPLANPTTPINLASQRMSVSSRSSFRTTGIRT